MKLQDRAGLIFDLISAHIEISEEQTDKIMAILTEQIARACEVEREACAQFIEDHPVRINFNMIAAAGIRHRGVQEAEENGKE